MRLPLSPIGALAALSLAGAASASFSAADYAGDHGQKKMGAFTAYVTYSYVQGKTAILTVFLTNTTEERYGGYITALGVSVPGGSVASTLLSTDDQDFNSLHGPFNVNPYGKFEAGGSVFSSFNGSGNSSADPRGGLAIGSHAEFSFLVTGNANKLATLSAETIFTKSGGGLVVRFRGLESGGGADRTFAYVLPGPGGLAVLALASVGGRRRRR